MELPRVYYEKLLDYHKKNEKYGSLVLTLIQSKEADIKHKLISELIPVLRERQKTMQELMQILQAALDLNAGL